MDVMQDKSTQVRIGICTEVFGELKEISWGIYGYATVGGYNSGPEGCL